jgi:hypothetical protein
MAYSLDLRQHVVDCVNQDKETQQATATSIDRPHLLVVVKPTPVPVWTKLNACMVVHPKVSGCIRK